MSGRMKSDVIIATILSLWLAIVFKRRPSSRVISRKAPEGADGDIILPLTSADALEPLSSSVLTRRTVEFGNGYLNLMAIIQAVPFVLVFTALQQHLTGHSSLLNEAATITQASGTVLAVMIVTHEYFQLTLVVRWTPTIFDTVLPYALGCAENWLALAIGGYESWWTALSALSAAAALAFMHTLRRTTAGMFGEGIKSYRRYCSIIRKQICICIIIAAVSVSMALLNPHGSFSAAYNVVLMWLVIFAGIGLAALREYDQKRVYDEYKMPTWYFHDE